MTSKNHLKQNPQLPSSATPQLPSCSVLVHRAAGRHDVRHAIAQRQESDPCHVLLGVAQQDDMQNYTYVYT